MYTCYVYTYIHTIVVFQPADFGQRMSRASNSVVYARALWRSIRDSKSLGEGPDRSSIAVPTAIEKACCSYAHRCCNWIAMLIYVFYKNAERLYIYFYSTTDICIHPLHHLINRYQEIPLVTENLHRGLCPLRCIFGPWVRSWDCLTTRSTSFLLDFGNWRLELSSTSSVPKEFDWRMGPTERICSTVVHREG